MHGCDTTFIVVNVMKGWWGQCSVKNCDKPIYPIRNRIWQLSKLKTSIRFTDNGSKEWTLIKWEREYYVMSVTCIGSFSDSIKSHLLLKNFSILWFKSNCLVTDFIKYLHICPDLSKLIQLTWNHQSMSMFCCHSSTYTIWWQIIFKVLTGK